MEGSKRTLEDCTLSTLGNILWIIFGGGLVLFIEYFSMGIAFCLTIIGIPFGIQCIKISFLAILPFGREIREKEVNTNALSTIMNILWIVSGGIVVTLTHLFFAVLLTITVIGIPFARQHLKLSALSLSPFGKQIIG